VNLLSQSYVWLYNVTQSSSAFRAPTQTQIMPVVIWEEVIEIIYNGQSKMNILIACPYTYVDTRNCFCGCCTVLRNKVYIVIMRFLSYAGILSTIVYVVRIFSQCDAVVILFLRRNWVTKFKRASMVALIAGL